MADISFGTIEARFADIIWEKEPIRSPELVKIAGEELNWKKSTTYTVLKRLCEKGIFKNENSIVSAVISKKDYFSAQSEKFVNQAFDGSLPAFLSAFTSRKELNEQEIEYLKELIKKYQK